MARRSREVIAKLAAQAGAEPRASWQRRLIRALTGRWKSRRVPQSGLVMFVGEDAPRNPDDPMSDPKVQARVVGKAIARRARRPKQ